MGVIFLIVVVLIVVINVIVIIVAITPPSPLQGMHLTMRLVVASLNKVIIVVLIVVVVVDCVGSTYGKRQGRWLSSLSSSAPAVLQTVHLEPRFNERPAVLSPTLLCARSMATSHTSPPPAAFRRRLTPLLIVTFCAFFTPHPAPSLPINPAHHQYVSTPKSHDKTLSVTATPTRAPEVMRPNQVHASSPMV